MRDRQSPERDLPALIPGSTGVIITVFALTLVGCVVVSVVAATVALLRWLF